MIVEDYDEGMGLDVCTESVMENLEGRTGDRGVLFSLLK